MVDWDRFPTKYWPVVRTAAAYHPVLELALGQLHRRASPLLRRILLLRGGALQRRGLLALLGQGDRRTRTERRDQNDGAHAGCHAGRRATPRAVTGFGVPFSHGANLRAASALNHCHFSVAALLRTSGCAGYETPGAVHSDALPAGYNPALRRLSRKRSRSAGLRK